MYDVPNVEKYQMLKILYSGYFLPGLNWALTLECNVDAATWSAANSSALQSKTTAAQDSIAGASAHGAYERLFRGATTSTPFHPP